MSNFNRIKVVLVEKDKTGKWLQNNLEKQLVLSVNGVRIAYNQTLKPLMRLPTCWMSM